MADSTLSPNMSLPVPTVSEAPGPTWAQLIDQCLSILDGHTHGPGQGVPISPSALLINADLPFNTNNATSLRTVRFSELNADPANPADIDCLYDKSGDLYFIDGAGNKIRITQSGSVAGAAGTITGLPSGTASASFAAGTFTFQSATSTPAAMNVGPVSIGLNSANSKQVTIAPEGGIAANYNLILPAALPAATNYLTLDNAGGMSYNTGGSTGTGAVVLATAPTITEPTLSGTLPSFTALGLITYPSRNTNSNPGYVSSVICSLFGTAGNSGTGETDLYSFTLAANSLSNNDVLVIKSIITQTNSCTFRGYFGGTQFLTTSGDSAIAITSWIARTSANNQLVVNQMIASSGSSLTKSTTTTMTVTDSSPVIIKVTGQSAFGSNTIICKMFQITYEPGQ